MALLARERLSRLLEASEQSASELARRIGCSKAYVSMIRSGDRYPNRRVANAIAEWSSGAPGGPISPSEWDADETADRQRAGAA